MNEYTPQIKTEYLDVIEHSSSLQSELEDLYFMALEENFEDFIRYEDIGNGHQESYVDPEYLVSNKEMVDYIKHNKGV